MRIAAIASTALVVAAILFATTAYADDDHRRSFTFEVTISNVTKGQVFSPPVFVTHSPAVSLFTAGEPALEELAIVAEDGMGGPLVDLISPLPQVFEAQATSAPLSPGASAVYEINSTRLSGVLSIV